MALDITTARLDIAKIYIAAFDRTADSAGLDFWVSSYMAGTDTLTSIAEKFTNSTEYKTAYPSFLTKTEYVEAIYNNVFNRASDADGKAFWVGKLNDGSLNTGTLMKAMVDAAMANTSSDGTMLTNQADYSVYAALNGVDTDLADARLDTITADAATLTAAKAVNPTNEAGVDNVLTTAQDVLTGTTGNDFFRAVAGATLGTQDQTTLNSSDIIDGSTGSDSLIVNMTGANYIGGARIKNIETLKIGTNLAAATFDYNVNMGSNEITEVTKIVADQINTTETLTLNNLVKTSGATVTLSWENDSNTLDAGTVNYNYRAAELTGTTDTQNVDLSNVANGVLNLAAGIETLSLTSNTARNTLNNSTLNADTLTNAVAADIISSGALTTVILDGSAEIGRSGGRVAVTGLTDRVIGNDEGISAQTVATASDLLSVGSRVTTVDASAATGATNVRFTAKNNNSATDVTFKGGSAADYVEFELGNVTATGGAGNDTFAFITNAAGVTNSTFGAADNISGGAGSDTIQIGLNATATYDVAVSEFANKTGIDTLDLRGAINNVTLSSAFAAASDAGLTVTTDNVVVGGTAPSNAEYAMVNTIDLTNLAANQGITFVGGQGSDRLILSDTTFTSAMVLNGGSNVNSAGVAVAGDFDTLTVVNGAILDRADLANVSGFEGLNLVKNVTGATTSRVELTKAFLLANTSAVNAAATATVDDTVFTISSVAGANGTALTSADTVTIDISDLLNSTRTAIDTTVATRGIDFTLLAATGATINYVVDGAAATLAQSGFVTKTATTPADITASVAVPATNSGITFTSSAVGANANVLGTNLNDTFNLSQADVVTAGTGTDTVNLNAGSAAASVTLGTGADIISVNTAIAARGVAVVATAVASTVNITVDQGAAANLTQEITGAFAHTYNVTANQTGLTVLNTAGATIAATAGGTFTLGAAGQIFTGSGTAAYAVTGAAGVDAITLTNSTANTITAAGGIDTITLTSSTGVDTVVLTSGDGTDSGTGTSDIGAVADRDVVAGFSAANDIIALTATNTIPAGIAGTVPVMTAVSATGALALANTSDITVLNFDLGGSTNVIGASTGGAALIANLGGALTTTAATDHGYIVAYDAGNAYVYAYDANFAVSDTAVTAAEINLVATLTGVTVGALAVTNFSLV